MPKKVIVNKGKDTVSKQPEDTAILQPIWTIYSNLKCPLIGMCLSIGEQRRILKKNGLSVKKETSYRIHSIMMAYLEKENKVSKKTDRLFKHKYRKDIAKYKNFNEQQLKEAWQDGLRAGAVPGLLYAIVSRTDISEYFLQNVYGDVHMMGHLNIEENIKSRRSLNVEVDVNRKLAKRLNREKKRTKELKQKNKDTAKSLADANLQLAAEKQKRESICPADHDAEGLKTENLKSKNRIRELETHLFNASKKKNLIEGEKRKLQIKMFEMESTNRLLADELDRFVSRLLEAMKCKDECDETCPEFHLCEKRILIVGGMTKMKKFYRNIVESSGGSFDYHDGYMKGGNNNLEERIAKSDMILCSVNCNSHNACKRVKKLCKKYNKPVKMLLNSSLNAIASALTENYAVLN